MIDFVLTVIQHMLELKKAWVEIVGRFVIQIQMALVKRELLWEAGVNHDDSLPSFPFNWLT